MFGTGISIWRTELGDREVCVTDDYGNAVECNRGQVLFYLHCEYYC